METEIKCNLCSAVKLLAKVQLWCCLKVLNKFTHNILEDDEIRPSYKMVEKRNQGKD